jgi:phytoene synthase
MIAPTANAIGTTANAIGSGSHVVGTAAYDSVMRPPDVVLTECRAILARGSKSFAAASRLLPARLRDPVAGYYAFCRVSDDLVDASADPRAALSALRARVDRIAAGDPQDHPADRALAWVMEEHAIDRAPIDALLEGYLWDVEGRRYDDLPSLRAYCARVAASVGVVMTRIMGVHDPRVLYRAAELGVAMQLTNIARDVGEDAQNGRLYLPRAWLRDPDATVRPTADVRAATLRLLDHADLLYARAELGIAALPRDCRRAIVAARAIYADIGRVIRAHDGDSVSTRAFTTRRRKLLLIATARLPRKAALDTPPLEEIRFLIPHQGSTARSASPSSRIEP